MGSMSHGQPARCTAMMASVRGVIACTMVRAAMFCETESTSANTGRAPTATMQVAEAMKLRGVVMTSSQVPTPRILKASSSARVAFTTATPYLQPTKSANSRSNRRPRNLPCPTQAPWQPLRSPRGRIQAMELLRRRRTGARPEKGSSQQVLSKYTCTSAGFPSGHGQDYARTIFAV